MIKTIAYFHVALFLIIPSVVFPVEISFFLGNISLVRNGRPFPIAVGNMLYPGDYLKTGDGSYLEIQYRDGSKIKLHEMSSATIGSKNIAGSDRVSLITGNATGSIKKLIKGSSKTYTPTIICAVRGTEYTLTVSAGGDTLVDVLEGAVEISNPFGAAAVQQNEVFETSMGEKPALSGGSRNEWKTSNDRDFEKNTAARSDRYDRQLKGLSDRNRETGDSLATVRSAVDAANNKESLENAGALLNSAAEKAEDGLLMNEALNFSVREIADAYQDRDDSVTDRYRSIEKKSRLVAEEQKKNLAALKKIREDYQKAHERIMGKYKDKLDEIKSKFNNKKTEL